LYCLPTVSRSPPLIREGTKRREGYIPCYHPLSAYQAAPGKPIKIISRKHLDFWKSLPESAGIIHIPCGQCIGCRLERSRQWALRCVHEASRWELNCFITLTYSEEYVPYVPSVKDGSTVLTLHKRDLQLFWKRLRKLYGENIKYYACGEYGTLYSRPHYHACIFNFDFIDKRFWKKKGSTTLYRSSSLESLWPYGYSTIGDVTFQSAAYVARYVTKKILGKSAVDKYDGRVPEYTQMSLRPAIGREFVDKFYRDIYPKDYVIFKNKRLRPPRYYDKIYDEIDRESFLKVKEARKEKLKLIAADCTEARLAEREKVQLINSKRLIRKYEQEM